MKERVLMIVGGFAIAGIGWAIMAAGVQTDPFEQAPHLTGAYWIGGLISGAGVVIALVGIIALGVALGMATHREQYSSPAP